eukprot:3950611-Amphidinium_carterae.1
MDSSGAPKSMEHAFCSRLSDVVGLVGVYVATTSCVPPWMETLHMQDLKFYAANGSGIFFVKNRDFSFRNKKNTP